MIWLLELELISFLGKSVFGNCRSSSEVTGVCLQGSRLSQWSEPGNKRNRPCLLSSTSFVSCQARGIVVLTGLLPSNTSPRTPHLSKLTPEPVGPRASCVPRPDPPLEALLSGVSLCAVFWCRFLMQIFIYKYF